MYRLVTDTSSASGDQASTLVTLFDRSVDDVYGYLVSRCRSAAVAEDLTSEVFMAAVAVAQSNHGPTLTPAWLIGVARNKLVDHWRHLEVEGRRLAVVAGSPDLTDDWDVVLDAVRAQDTLDRLGAHHRAALTLRYLDGLPVPEVAATLDRTVHATEALLIRAKAAFRREYGEVTS